MQEEKIRVSEFNLSLSNIEMELIISVPSKKMSSGL